jgi:hypothetical protein
MFKDEYGIALKKWVDARKRADAAEERIGHAFIDWYFRRDTNGTAPSHPCVNVTPPKQPPKK